METSIPNTPKRAFTEREAACYIGMSRSFLRHGRINGKRDGHIPPPKFIKAGKKKIIYIREDLDSWIDQFSRVEHLAQLKHHKNMKEN